MFDMQINHIFLDIDEIQCKIVEWNVFLLYVKHSITIERIYVSNYRQETLDIMVICDFLRRAIYVDVPALHARSFVLEAHMKSPMISETIHNLDDAARIESILCKRLEDVVKSIHHLFVELYAVQNQVLIVLNANLNQT